MVGRVHWIYLGQLVKSDTTRATDAALYSCDGSDHEEWNLLLA